jgi:hypothetical protein
VAALRRAARERAGPLPSVGVADALLDERRERAEWDYNPTVARNARPGPSSTTAGSATPCAEAVKVGSAYDMSKVPVRPIYAPASRPSCAGQFGLHSGRLPMPAAAKRSVQSCRPGLAAIDGTTNKIYKSLSRGGHFVSGKSFCGLCDGPTNIPQL